MSDFRKERITKLFCELEYEITRGVMEGDIEENFGFSFLIPVSKTLPNGLVHCAFHSRAISRDSAIGGQLACGPNLSLVTD